MLEIIVIFLLLSGALFFSGTALGVLRFPDLFTRIHAASKGDTLSSFCLLLACALYNAKSLESGDIIVSIKIMFILIFISLASPTAAHAITAAALSSGAQPWTKKKEDVDTEGEE